MASLVETTGRPRIDIVQSLKAVYGRHESNEYPFAIQESALFHPYRADFDSFDALVIARPARPSARRGERYLHPYPGVLETLRPSSGARGCRWWRSPTPRAMPSRAGSGCSGSTASSTPSTRCAATRSPTNVDPEIRRQRRGGPLPAQGDPRHRAAPPSHEKPDPRGLRRILRRPRAWSRREVLYVGDNVQKDMPLAQAWGRARGLGRVRHLRLDRVPRAAGGHLREAGQPAPRGRRAAPARWPLAISSFTQVLDAASRRRGGPGRARLARRPPRRR